MMQTVFRLAQSADIPVLREIYLAGMRSLHAKGIPQWSEVYPVRMIPQDIEKGELFAIDSGKATVGAVAIDRHLDSFLNDIPFTPANAFYVHRLVVNPAAQGRGIAKATMRFAESYARARGGTAIRLDTSVHNEVALRLYESLGYRKCGEFELYDRKYTALELLFAK